MQLNELLKKEIENKLQQYTKEKVEIKNSFPVTGGDIHSAFQLETNEGSFFLKAAKNIPPDLFKKEYHGLELLRRQNAIRIAKPLFHGSCNNHNFLLMEYISKSTASPDFWNIFAGGLAALHRCTHDSYGLNEDNYIGPLPQHNKPFDNWPDFFVSQRLQPLIRKCIDQKLLDKVHIEMAMNLYKRIPGIFPDEPPALLHGDLWGGNYLSGPGGKPCLFDPAVYYGFREMDLAMTRLFGGFDRRFYWHYEEYYPLSPDWQKRIPLCQLYPLLVHSLLFGGGYVQQVRRILEEYGT